MNSVNIAKTFNKSAGVLPANDRARVFDFLTKFMEDPTQPGLSVERIQRSPDPNVWSARITGGLRAVYHLADSAYTLLYAGQHDEAYDWAARRKLEHHPVTGAFQIVEIAEGAELPPPVPTTIPDPPKLFERYSDDYLLSLGVPPSWLPTIREILDEIQLLTVVERLPEEVAERLLQLADGELVTPPPPVAPTAPLAASPDNLRRFWVVEEASELRSLLERPMEDWIRFLHPSQRELATRAFSGPAKVTGSAGTGKTVVAMHRARHLAKQGSRVLLTSFVTTLCKNIEQNLHILCTPAECERVTVATVHSQALCLARKADASLQPTDAKQVNRLIQRYRDLGGAVFDQDFLEAEWAGVIETRGIRTWDEYRDVQRTGRGRGLQVRERRMLWKVFEPILAELADRHLAPWPLICRRAAELVQAGAVSSPFDAVIVDEVQDLQPQEVRFLAALAASNPGNLMLIGDAGQRIYPGGYSLRSLGIDVRGRSRVLRINYRTTEQIRRFADGILPDATDDLDGGQEPRKGTRSLLKGPAPTVHGFTTAQAQDAFVLKEVQRLLAEGLQPREIAVFTRVGARLEPLQQVFAGAGVAVRHLSRDSEPNPPDGVHFGTMHRAKGLEYKVVFAYDCTEGVMPHTPTLHRIKDPADYEAARARERQLLYVTITRARDEAYVTWAGLPSPFLPDLS